MFHSVINVDKLVSPISSKTGIVSQSRSKHILTDEQFISIYPIGTWTHLC